MGAHYLSLSSPWLSLLPPLVAPVPFTSTSVCLVWCILHFSTPYSLLLLLSRTSVSVLLSYLILTYLLFFFLTTFSSYSPFLFSVFLFWFFSSPPPSVNLQKWKNPTQNTHTHSLRQLLRHANVSQNTYSLPHTHHHTIKRKSWSNSCCVSACTCVCLPDNCVPCTQCINEKPTTPASLLMSSERQKTNVTDSLVRVKSSTTPPLSLWYFTFTCGSLINPSADTVNRFSTLNRGTTLSHVNTSKDLTLTFLNHQWRYEEEEK